jgi:hypothetical protein
MWAKDTETSMTTYVEKPHGFVVSRFVLQSLMHGSANLPRGAILCEAAREQAELAEYK